MEHTLAALRTLAETLKLCKLCTSKLTGGDAKEEREAPQPANDITYRNASLSDVRFTDCDFQKVIVKKCEWNNVVFTNCSFSDVIFDRVTLKDIHFYNLELENVNLQDVNLRQTIWNHTNVSKAFLGPTSLKDTSLAVFGSPYKRTAVYSTAPNLIIDLPAFPSSNNPILRSVTFSENGTDQKCRLLDLPPVVLESVMRNLYPRESALMYRFTTNNAESIQRTRQTTYETTHSPGLTTTYYGNLKDVSVRPARSPRMSLPTAFLRVNKLCYKLGIRHVYARTFKFYGRPETCLAFLHDHRRVEHQIKRIVLGYNPKEFESTGLKYEITALPAWRRLFNVLVHECADVFDVTLYVRPSFWDSMPWRDGPAKAFDHVVPQQLDLSLRSSDRQKNFFQHVARLPTKNWGVGRTFKLEIGDSGKDAERRAFLKAFEKLLWAQMDERPKLAESRYGVCKEKQLTKSCYWKDEGRATANC